MFNIIMDISKLRHRLFLYPIAALAALYTYTIQAQETELNDLHKALLCHQKLALAMISYGAPNRVWNHPWPKRHVGAYLSTYKRMINEEAEKVGVEPPGGFFIDDPNFWVLMNSIPAGVPRPSANQCRDWADAFDEDLADLARLYPDPPPAEPVQGEAKLQGGGASIELLVLDERFATTVNETVFIRDLTGKELKRLKPPENCGKPCGFGRVMASDGGMLAIGAPYADRAKGRVYLYDAITGEEIASIDPPHPKDKQFGRSLAMDGTSLLVGTSSDAAYLINALSGEVKAKLFPNGIEPRRYGVSLGYSTAVALDSEFAVVSSLALGGLSDDQTFIYDARTGEQLHKLVSPPKQRGDLIAGFGTSLAVNDGILAIGAPTGHGSVFLYKVATGEQIGRLQYEGNKPVLEFGCALDMAEGLLAISTCESVRSGNLVMLYDLEKKKFIGPKISAFDGSEFIPGRNESRYKGQMFGASLALRRNLLLVGAPRAKPSGAIYRYDLTKLLESNAQASSE